MSENVLNPKAALHQKMKAMSADILKADWLPDKSYELPSKSGGRSQTVKYVSLSKIKRNIAPVLCNSSVDMDVSFSEPKAIGENIYVQAYITFTDVETGASETYQSSGMSSKGDKALQIAQSFAVKTYLTNRFMIIDGADPDSEDLTRQKSAFGHRSMNEVNEIKSRIQENAIPADEKQPEEVVAVDEKALAESKGATDSIGYIMSSLEARTVNNIVTAWKQKLSSGEVSADKYKEMDDARLDANSKDAVLEFIRKYRVI